MNYRRFCIVAEGLLLAVVLLLHVGLFLIRPAAAGVAGNESSSAFAAWREQTALPRGDNPFLEILAEVLPFCQLALLIAFLIVGPSRFWARLLIAAPLAMLWWSCWHRPLDWELSWRSVLSSQAAFFPEVGVLAIAGMLVVRLFGWRLVRRGSTEAASAQFSLASLLLITAAFAVVVASAEALRPTLSEHYYLDAKVSEGAFGSELDKFDSWLLTQQRIRQLILATALTLTSIGTLWAVLGAGRPWLRFAALLLLLPALGGYLSHLGGAKDAGLWSTALNLSVAMSGLAALMAVSLLPVRFWNFRLLRVKS